jgi:hypothetical protein
LKKEKEGGEKGIEVADEYHTIVYIIWREVLIMKRTETGLVFAWTKT